MKFVSLIALGLMCTMSTGCGMVMRPFDTPEYAEIQHHETGYAIPLEGANKEGQAKFDSKEALEQNRVAIKRVQIPHRWVQTGRFFANAGEYIDTIRLVVVDRTPVTREWSADEDVGTSSKNEALWLESRDSIGFSLGFNCTAFIDEPDTSDFLYWYPTAKSSGNDNFDKSTASLQHTMDEEIRARVQMLANTVSAKYDLDDLRARKAEILNAVRNGVPEEVADGVVVQEQLMGTVEHFAARGITITNLGQFGGFEYKEANIQDAINETFVAQQEKVRTEAAFEAQQRKNDTLELAANATAEKARRIAQGEADAIRMVATATKEAGKDPLFLKLKELEVEEMRIEQWDGVYPTTMFTMGNGEDAPQLLMSLPAPQ